jgi:anti-sigma factor RsiW
MTNDCGRARTWMLEADLSELRAVEASPVADHLARCGECSRRAAAIVAGMAGLDDSLAALLRNAPPRPAAVLRIRPAAARRVVLWAAPLALAAGMAAVMLARPAPPPGEHPGVTAERIAQRLFVPAPVARAADGRGVAVLETNDPGITVVWIY